MKCESSFTLSTLVGPTNLDDSALQIVESVFSETNHTKPQRQHQPKRTSEHVRILDGGRATFAYLKKGRVTSITFISLITSISTCMHDIVTSAPTNRENKIIGYKYMTSQGLIRALFQNKLMR